MNSNPYATRRIWRHLDIKVLEAHPVSSSMSQCHKYKFFTAVSSQPTKSDPSFLSLAVQTKTEGVECLLTNSNIVVGHIYHRTPNKKRCGWISRLHAEAKLQWLSNVTSGHFHIANAGDDGKLARNQVIGRQP